MWVLHFKALVGIQMEENVVSQNQNGLLKKVTRNTK